MATPPSSPPKKGRVSQLQRSNGAFFKYQATNQAAIDHFLAPRPARPNSKEVKISHEYFEDVRRWVRSQRSSLARLKRVNQRLALELEARMNQLNTVREQHEASIAALTEQLDEYRSYYASTQEVEYVTGEDGCIGDTLNEITDDQ